MTDKHLNEMAEKAVDDWKLRSSITFLECAINLMMTHMSKKAVIKVMRAEIKMLKDLD